MTKPHLPWIVLVVAVVVTVLGLWATPAGATDGEDVDVACPVCSLKFTGWEAHSSNTFGGTDSDFCTHALGGQVFLLALWTCPRCAYTGMRDAFDPLSLPTALVERLKKENVLKPLQPIGAEVRRTTEIPALVRWDLMRQVQELSGDVPPRRRASTLLQMAWTQRFDFQFPKTVEEELNELTSTYRYRARHGEGLQEYEMSVEAAGAMLRDATAIESVLTPRERQVRLVGAAVLYKSRGEDLGAARALARLKTSDPRLAPPLQAIVDDVAARITREREALGRTAPLLQEVLDGGQLDGESPQGLRYLLAELHRKLGDTPKARAILGALEQDKDLSEDLRPWVADALRKIAAPEDSKDGR